MKSIKKLQKADQKVHKSKHRLFEKEEKLSEKEEKLHKSVEKMEKKKKPAKNKVVKHAKKNKIQKVLHEFKHGTLHSGSKKGPEVKSRKQAVAIALSEARKAGESVKPKKKRK